MYIVDAVQRKNLQCRLQETHESLSADGVVSVSVDVAAGEIYELLDVILEKSDDNTKDTYFLFNIVIDGIRAPIVAGWQSASSLYQSAFKSYGSLSLDMAGTIFEREMKVYVWLDGMSAGEKVGVMIRYRVYSKKDVMRCLEKMGLIEYIRGGLA